MKATDLTMVVGRGREDQAPSLHCSLGLWVVMMVNGPGQGKTGKGILGRG